MAKGNLIAKKKKNTVRRKVYVCKFRAGGKSKRMEFNALNDGAALKYCGFDKTGAQRGKGYGLMGTRLPRGAKITAIEPTGRVAKKT